MTITARNTSTPVKVPIGRISSNNGVDDGFKISSTVFGTNAKNGFIDTDFRVKIAKHENASMAYSRRVHNVKVPHFSVRAFLNNGSGATANGRGFSYGGLTTYESIPNRSLPNDMALKSVKGKIARDVEAFKTLIPLAELKETRGLLRSVAQSTGDLLKSLIALKHGRGSPRQVFREASRAWLTFSFGVSPTIGDINALVQTISSTFRRDGQFLRVYGTGREDWFEVFTGSAKSDTLCSGVTMVSDGRCQLDHSYSVRYTAGLLLNVLSGNEYGLSDHFGLTFGDLPSVGWEIIPFSWVVDYFTTTGAFLEDLFYTMPGNTVYLTKSVKYSIRARSAVSLSTPNPAWKIISGSGSQEAVCETFMFDRTNLSALPHRSFRFKTADEIGINSVKRILNLASILLSK